MRLLNFENIFMRKITWVSVGLLLFTSNLRAVPAVNFARGTFGILNCGSQEGMTRLPDAYFDFLQRMNMQWVDIGVTLHVDNSVDSNVRRFYSTDYANYVPTFPDSSIITMVQQLHAHGYKVLINLSLDEPWPEDGSVNPALPPGKAAWRYQIGDPATPTGYTLAEWPWNPSNTNHTAFVKGFWSSYTREVVHYATLCEQQGVEVLQVGAETQELFRTRAIGTKTNHFRTQIQALMDSTRAHYTGNVGYYMHSGTWKKAYHNVDTLYHELWGDAGFDVIGGSIYGLVTPKTTVAANTLAYMKSQFTTIFTTYFGPVVRKYPTKTVAILECGIPVWNKTAVFAEPDGNVLMNREDLNSNGIIDAEEVQTTMFNAYYSVADSLGYPQPGFIFGDEAATDAITHMRSAYPGYGIRNRDAERSLMFRFRNVTFTSTENTPPRLLTKTDSNYVAIIGEDFSTTPFKAVDDDTGKGDFVRYRTVWSNYPWFGASPSQGTVTGIPQDDDAGWWQAKLFAQDIYGSGTADTASFILWTIHPRSPEVTSVPPTTMVPGQAVNYQIKVVDGSGAPITTGLTYSMLVNPFFLSVSSSGKVTGMPTFAVAGTVRAAEIKITKTTAPTAVYYDSWKINVTNSNDPPTWGGDGKLLDPKNGFTYPITSPITFRVGYSNDLNDDTLFYNYRIFGPGFDTSFIRKSGVISRTTAQKWDTANIRFSLNLDGRLAPGQTYSWYVKVTDKKDTLTSETWTFKAQGGTTPVQNTSYLPLKYSLGQATFNPYNRTFTIPFAIPKSGAINLKMYDGLGNQVGVLSRGFRKAGSYGLSFDANPYRGQLYFYKMEAENFSAVRKMILFK